MGAPKIVKLVNFANVRIWFPGFAGIIWYVAWLWLSFDKPCKHPTISQEELIYIEESIGNVADNVITVGRLFWLTILRDLTRHFKCLDVQKKFALVSTLNEQQLSKFATPKHPVRLEKVRRERRPHRSRV